MRDEKHLNGGSAFENIWLKSVTYNVILRGRLIKNNAFFFQFF